MFKGRTFKRSELRYYMTEKEQDHKALTFITKCKILNYRLYRWIFLIQGKGTENVVGDIISRNPIGQENYRNSNEQEIIVANLERVVNQNIRSQFWEIRNKCT